MPDLRSERNHDEQDDAKGNDQAGATVLELAEAPLACRIGSGHNLQTVLDNGIHPSGIRGVDLGPRERQMRSRLGKGELLRADLYTAFLTRATSVPVASMAPFKRSMSPRIASAATAPLSSGPPWHVAQMACAPVPSISSDGLSTA